MDAQKQREKCPGRGLAEEGTSLPVAFQGGCLLRNVRQHPGKVTDWRHSKAVCHISSTAKLSLFSGDFIKNCKLVPQGPRTNSSAIFCLKDLPTERAIQVLLFLSCLNFSFPFYKSYLPHCRMCAWTISMQNNETSCKICVSGLFCNTNSFPVSPWAPASLRMFVTLPNGPSETNPWVCREEEEDESLF